MEHARGAWRASSSMDVNSLPFVKSSYTVRRVRGTPTVIVSEATLATDPRVQEATLQGGSQLRRMLTYSDLEESGSGEGSGKRENPHSAVFAKDGNGGPGRRLKRRREHRPDVFDHLAQLKRKQLKFDNEQSSYSSSLQEVPASPLPSSDVSFSFHTPSKTPHKQQPGHSPTGASAPPTPTTQRPFELQIGHGSRPLTDSFTAHLTSVAAEELQEMYPQSLGGSWVSGEGDSGGYDGGGGFQPLDLSGGVRFGRRMFRAVLDQSPVQQSCDQGRRKRPPTESVWNHSEFGSQLHHRQFEGSGSPGCSLASRLSQDSGGFAEVPAPSSTVHPLSAPFLPRLQSSPSPLALLPASLAPPSSYFPPLSTQLLPRLQRFDAATFSIKNYTPREE